MFRTLRNAWKIPDIRRKILFTLLIIVLYRLGANLPVPFVKSSLFTDVSLFASGSILTYLNILSGEALSRATLFALGVSPYITASIVMQLLTIAIGPLEKLAKEGEEGRKKINMITRFVAVGLALVTAIGYMFYLNSQGWLAGDLNWFRGIVIVSCYCAGAALVMWLAEQINDKGIGNGISIILFANIIAGFSTIATNLWNLAFKNPGFNVVGLIVGLVELVAIFAMVLLIIWMNDAERRIPVQYAKRVVGRKMYGGQSTNLPIKVAMAGVMPIIFANSIVSIPATIVSFMTKENWFTKFVNNWFNYNTWPYLVVFLILLIAFAFFYIAISFNPVEVANNIQQNGGAIMGIRPGRPTVEFIKRVLNRVTLVGAILVAIIAIFPMIANIIGSSVANGAYAAYFAPLAFGGSSLIIVVGVALETVRELEAQMSLRNYKGFLD